jgi:hypothetical protein
MKTASKLLAVLTVSLTLNSVRAQDVPPPPDQGDQADQGDQGDDQGVSFQTFYDQLGDQGTWIQTDNYGYVFQPNVTDPNWAPYTDGHWVYTDEGWTWVSDEPWGWATYHYGRWANIDGTGWVWVPGYRWAPAWVSWRYGGGYAGWAPLPPETFIGAEYGDGGTDVNVGFHFGSDVDVNFNIGPGCYNFVQVGDMGDPNYRGHYIDRSRNYTVINHTTNITNINVNKTTVNNNYGGGATGAFRGVSAGGPSIATVNAHSRTHIPTVQLTAANQAGRSTLQGNSLAVYAPRVNPTSARTAKPARVGQTLATPTFNRGDSITKPLDVTSSVRAPAPSAAAVQAATAAQAHVPAKARIATEKTTIKTPLSRPLTSMQPVAQVHPAATTAPAANNFNNEKPASPTEEHSAVSAPYTGESEKPAPTYHPETEVKPAATYHPESEDKPAPTYHPQTEVKPAATYHPEAEVKPAEAYHPQAEISHEPAAVSHPQAPAAVNHPAPAEKPAAKPEEKKKADDKKDPQGH